MRAQNILVFRIGQLGDTIVALPAMWAVKNHFRNARFTLLCDRHPGKPFVLAAVLLRGTDIFDEFKDYIVNDSANGRLARPFRMLGLLWRLRRGKFDALVYLAPSARTAEQVARDRKFFSAAGIKHFIGMRGFVELPKKVPGQPLGATLPESDLILARLAADGIPVPPIGKGSLDLRLGPMERAEVEAWTATLLEDGARIWIGIGPGSKMPAKLWPEVRFREVVMKLIKAYDVWPIIFGGEEDRELGQRLLRTWGRGHNAAGALSLRGAGEALRRCKLYLGNDTGTMHLAAAVGIPCVAVFSSREWPGMWFPYGVKQKVFRSPIECEGCGLIECLKWQNECLNRIQVRDVLAACEEFLAQN